MTFLVLKPVPLVLCSSTGDNNFKDSLAFYFTFILTLLKATKVLVVWEIKLGSLENQGN